MTAASWSGRRTETFYCTVRPLAVLSKILGAFPFTNALNKDGRKLKFSIFSLIHVWNILMGVLTVLLFMYFCSKLLELLDDDIESLRIWTTLTCYVTSFRTCVQFIILNLFAYRMPELLNALEEYHQVIGSNIIKNYRGRWMTCVISVSRIIIVLLIMEFLSLFFFDQMNGESVIFAAWPVALTYLYANMWRELPMNLFVLICKYLTARFIEIKTELKKVREKELKDETASDIEGLRLQHAALTKIMSLLQHCYGIHIAVNMLFLLFDTVLQVFLYVVVTSSSNVMLFLLSAYFLVMTGALIEVIDELERTDGSILQEISEFKLCATSNDQQVQIQMFTVQLTARPTKLSASGYFSVNNGIICSILSAVATYFLVLVQFTPYFELHLKNITLPSFNF